MERTDFPDVVATLARELASGEHPWPTPSAIDHLSNIYDVTPGEATQLAEAAATLLRIEQAIASHYPAGANRSLHCLSGEAIPDAERASLGYHLTQDGQTGTAALLVSTPSGHLMRVEISARCCGHC